MKREGTPLRLTATDVTTFAACPHATALDLEVASGTRPRAPFYPDPSAQLLRERGRAHEAAYLAKLRASRSVEEILEHSPDAADRTLDAMKRGVDVIYQGTLRAGPWLGRPDFLVRVERTHGAWEWSYEPADAKLALTAKVNALLQLCFYAELLTQTQGVRPAHMTLVLGDMHDETFATARYEAYFRWIRRCLEQAVASPLPTYPEPVEHCDVCDWFSECNARLHADDHLSLVAGITTSQRRALDLLSVRTVRDLAATAPDVRVEGIGDSALVRIREQARIQVRGRDEGKPVYDLIAGVEPGHGLMRLPVPSPGDLFIDFEGDPYALGDGIEYLVGIVEPGPDGASEASYTPLWAFDRAGERAAFERLMDVIARRRTAHPEMHVYHYAPYEPTALKRLAGRYATRVDELDELLRGKVFVDLYAVVRQGVRAGVESYSIKRLEPLYAFERQVPLREANRHLGAFAVWLERRGSEEPPDDVRTAVAGYNRDDCVSALRLRAWLEHRRTELEAQRGSPLPRPTLEDSEASEGVSEEVARVRPVMEALLAGVPDEQELRSQQQQAQYVLAHLLEWHRREDKSTYWEYFRLCDLPDQDLLEERAPLSGLTYEGVIGTEARSRIHRYRFPVQDHAIDRALDVHDPRTERSAGVLHDIDDTEGIVDLKRGNGSAVPHPTALVAYDIVGTKEQRASLLRLGERIRDHGFVTVPRCAAALSLLQRAHPLPARSEANEEEAAIARALAVDGRVLPVQGPPGTGKTRLGARMIVALLRQGKRVGITANSHKVITNLLDEACRTARKEKVTLRAIQKVGSEGGEDDVSKDASVTVTKTNGDVVGALGRGAANVFAGTSWLWAREEMIGAVDVLFVDEAGQMSLANVLASAPASNGVVLLGDPQQLDQPQKGVHPPGVAVSALGHILGDAATMTPERGLFLEQTWRMHPDVCAYISEVFYDGRLQSRPELSRLRLDAPGSLGGTGLRFVPVPHRGNRNESVEEAQVVARIVRGLLGANATWTDREGNTSRLRLEDIVIVAPYNAHVARLERELPGARVGTVDKFQGQEAPVAIYSMATSTPDEAPRGLEFLYSGNRLNVAISRARCAAFLVASPALFEVRCKTERQVRLVNAFRRYLEAAAVCTVA